MTNTTLTQNQPYDLFTPEAMANPYPVYTQLYQESPVYWHPQFEGWFITHYDDVKALLHNPHVVTQPDLKNKAKKSQLPPAIKQKMMTLGEFISHWLIVLPPKRHKHIRQLLNKGFKPQLITALRPHIQDIANMLLDALQSQAETDIIQDFAYPLPALVIADMLGFPRSDRHLFRTWSKKILDFFSFSQTKDSATVDRMHETITEMKAYLQEIVAQRRQNPQDDIISNLLAAEEQGHLLTETELFSNCILMFFAGHETTTNLIGNGLLALLHHPYQLEKLVNDPALIPTAVEELLRYDPPTQTMGRTAIADIEVQGHPIQAGERVILCIGAANRDPRQFSNPAELDISRAPNPHLSFGLGEHFCLGAPLARLEGEIAFRTLLQRLSGLQLASQPVTWRQGFALHGLNTLPVTIDQVLSK